MSLTVLVVDDNQTAGDALAAILRREGYTAEALCDGASAQARLDAGGVDVVLTDLKMEPVDGLQVLAHARALPRPPEVVMLTGYGTVDTAVRALQLGALDFLTKPVPAPRVLEILGRLQGRGTPRRIQEGSSPAAQALAQRLHAVATAGSTALLLGEPGSGRLDAARQIHSMGSRADRPFRVLAHPDRAPADLAAAGVVYLPAADHHDPRDQVKILQLLDEVNQPQVIAAASPGWTGDPAFPAYYYRLAVLVVHIPPLRDRLGDLPSLLEARLAAREKALGRSAPRPTPAQVAALQRHHWPGNLRELDALVERAVVFGAEGFEPTAERATDATAPEVFQEGFSLQDHLEAVERDILVRALHQAEGDRAVVSRILGVERNTLRYKLNKYGLLERA